MNQTVQQRRFGPNIPADIQGHFSVNVQARKRHININFLVWFVLGQTQIFSLFYTLEAQFVPGTNWVCPGTNPGSKGGRKSYVLKVYVPFSLAKRPGRKLR